MINCIAVAASLNDGVGVIEGAEFFQEVRKNCTKKKIGRKIGTYGRRRFQYKSIEADT
jgi:hypothetical protein